jgi:uncharacterized OB-fold protein
MPDDRLTHAEWKRAVREGKLLGQECGVCGRTQGTPKAACPHCGSTELATVELPTEGVVYTETTINVPPEGIDERGYQVAVVEVGDARVLGRLDDEGVAIEDPVALSGFDEDERGNATPRFEAQ